MKKKFVALGLATAAFTGIGVAACDTDPATKPSSVSQGGAAKSAAKDVKLGDMSTPYGTVEIPVTVTNHSSKPSDYSIEASIFNHDGVQVGTATTYIQRVMPHHKAKDKLIAVDANDAITYKLTKVERTASL